MFCKHLERNPKLCMRAFPSWTFESNEEMRREGSGKVRHVPKSLRMKDGAFLPETPHPAG